MVAVIEPWTLNRPTLVVETVSAVASRLAAVIGPWILDRVVLVAELAWRRPKAPKIFHRNALQIRGSLALPAMSMRRVPYHAD